MAHTFVGFVGGLLLAAAAIAQPASIDVRADNPGHPVSRYMTGACLEDVNHEVYGGIYSQMIFGESFQEPGRTGGFKEFTVADGNWKPKVDGVEVSAGLGPKLVANDLSFASGQASVEIFFAEQRDGNAGLLLKCNHAGAGADNFDGYEVSLESRGILVLGRHRHNWEPIRTVVLKPMINRWVKLSVKCDEHTLDISVDDAAVLKYEDKEHPLPAGGVALRAWQRPAQFRKLEVFADRTTRGFKFDPLGAASAGAVSGMWNPLRTGSAKAEYSLITDHPFIGTQSQSITFVSGQGDVGIENRGLNRWGMAFIAGKPYEGYLWLKSPAKTAVVVSAESLDGSKIYAEMRLEVASPDWQRVDFSLTPSGTDPAARFCIRLKDRGSITLGHAFVQPGPWGRFKNLPIRKDVADGLIAEGVTVLRYGGSMINDPEYRWKKMLGPRDRRPPYKGTWYPYSSNGFGIIDFLNFCDAAGILCIPDLDNNESPADIADFIEYVNGPADSVWGRRRVEDGHPAPYGLKYIELGNEEAVDEVYWQKFKPLAEAIWAKDPGVTPVVGDFAYGQRIADPFHFAGAPRINTLAAHKKILDFAATKKQAVWFDVHIWNDEPKNLPPQIDALQDFIAALGKISPGADFKVCVFEENANHHTHRRALAHALTIAALTRLADHVPIVCAANCLQCDGQNDNGWDQGLLFLSPSQVWAQPSYYVTQMVSRQWLPLRVETAVHSADGALDAIALRSEDPRLLQLQVTNISDQPCRATIRLGGFAASDQATISEIAGNGDADNTAAEPGRIASHDRAWKCDFHDGATEYMFPPGSFTIIRFHRAEP